MLRTKLHMIKLVVLLILVKQQMQSNWINSSTLHCQEVLTMICFQAQPVMNSLKVLKVQNILRLLITLNKLVIALIIISLISMEVIFLVLGLETL